MEQRARFALLRSGKQRSGYKVFILALAETQQVIVKLTEPEIFGLFIFVAAEQIHDLPFAGYVTDFLRRT